MTGGKLLLLDGNSLVYRAFFALPALTTSRGVSTGAVFGFTNMLLRLMQEEAPDFVAVGFDKGRAFRYDRFEVYKAHRPPTPDELKQQLPFIREILGCLRIPIFEVAGYEADDVLGTLARQAEKEGLDVLVVSGDRDTLQLVSDRVRAVLTKKGITEMEAYDAETVRQKYGISPPQLVDLKGLMGDESDNIPGVPGIGEKTAVRLLQEFGTLEGIISSLGRVSPPKVRAQLEAAAQQAFLSKELATIVTEVPVRLDLEGCRVREPDMPRLRRVFTELEFRNLLKRLEEMAGPSPGPLTPGATDVVGPGELEVLAAVLREAGEFSFALLRSGQGPGSRWLCLSAFVGPGRAYYVPFATGPGLGGNDPDEVCRIIGPVFADASVKKVVHDAKSAVVALRQRGACLEGVSFDPMIAAYLLNPARSGYGLEALAMDYLGLYLPEIESLTGKGKNSIPVESVRPQDLRALAVRQAECAWRLKEVLPPELEANGLMELFTGVEMPLVQVLAEMEINGVAVDREYLRTMSTELGARIEELTREVYGLAGGEFNINSTKQLSEVLFVRLKLPVVKRTKTGFSTDVEVLEQLASRHEIVDRILQYRQLVKLKGTYVDGLGALVDPASGRVHTTFHQTVTATGRISSAEPNLQNIPARMELGKRIRKAFVAGQPGHVILTADYSQIELRVLAHMSGDEDLIAAFQRDEDIHLRTAAEVFGVPIDQVTPQMRTRAKAVNFGIVYGISEYGLARDIGVSRQEAERYIKSYFARYRGVKEYVERTVREARENGYVTTLLRRRRYLPDIRSKKRNVRLFAERTAMNTPIQGSAADIIKLAMVRVYAELRKRRLRAKLILQVHDELLFELPAAEVEAVKELAREAMERAVELKVPLKVDVSVGPSWYDATKV